MSKNKKAFKLVCPKCGTRGEYAAFLEGVDIALQGDCIVEKIV